MAVNQVHPLTMKALGDQSELLSLAFQRETESDDPAYFAPFLRARSKQGLLEEWVGELASWEWALYHAYQAQDLAKRSHQGSWACADSLSFVILKWDILEWIKTQKTPARRERLFKIWFDSVAAKSVAEEISLEEAYVLEALREGPVPHEHLVVQITARGADVGLLEQLHRRGVLKRLPSA